MSTENTKRDLERTRALSCAIVWSSLSIYPHGRSRLCSHARWGSHLPFFKYLTSARYPPSYNVTKELSRAANQTTGTSKDQLSLVSCSARKLQNSHPSRKKIKKEKDREERKVNDSWEEKLLKREKYILEVLLGSRRRFEKKKPWECALPNQRHGQYLQ